MYKWETGLWLTGGELTSGQSEFCFGLRFDRAMLCDRFTFQIRLIEVNMSRVE